MLSEALDRLVSLGNKAKEIKTLPIGDYQRLEIAPDGATTVRQLPVKPVARKLETFDGFLTYVSQRSEFAGDGAESDFELPEIIAHEGSVVFYSEKEFAYLENPGLHTGLKAVFSLKKSEPFMWLETGSSKFQNQQDFVRTLRITLRDVLPPGNLLQIVREVKFTNNASGAGVVQHGKQSMSREIINEVKGTGVIPEDVTLNVQPFENLPFKCNVDCAIEIDEQACAFRITPFPGRLRKCIDTVLAMAHEQLSSASITCHQGQVA